MRRSNPEKQSQARVYKPRTAQQSYTQDYQKEEETTRKPRREDSRKPREEKRSGAKSKSDAPTYMPRTRQGFEEHKEREQKSTSYPKKEREKPVRSKEEDSGKSYKKFDKKSSVKFEDKPPRRERDKPLRKERDKPLRSKEKDTGKSYYEEKFGKKTPVKFDDKSPKRVEKKPAKTRTEKAQVIEFDAKLKTDKDGLIRLNKYIANSGLCSRRDADEFITKGYVTVNDQVVTELGSKVKLTDTVCFKGKSLDPEKKVYILLNKPKDYVTTVDDPHATKTVMELIEGACDQRVYPVGRLDRNSSGLLLFTNDGELTKRLTHPKYMKTKIYEVGLDRNVTLADMDTIRQGVDIGGEVVAADAIEYVDIKDKTTIGIEIHSGQNRVVRRIFEQLGYRVYKLDRVYFAGLTKKNLPRGKWRFLTQKEVNMLKMNRF